MRKVFFVAVLALLSSSIGCAVQAEEPVEGPIEKTEEAARKTCPLPSCAPPPDGCRYEGMVTFPCNKVTCGRLVCDGSTL